MKTADNQGTERQKRTKPANERGEDEESVRDEIEKEVPVGGLSVFHIQDCAVRAQATTKVALSFGCISYGLITDGTTGAATVH